MAVASPSSVWSRHTNPGLASARALTGSSSATNPASSGPSRGARRVAMFTWARCWAAMAAADHGPGSMSILIVFRNDGHAAAVRGRVHDRPARVLAQAVQQPLDEAEVHGADQHRELGREVGEGAVAQPQGVAVPVGLIAPGRQDLLDRRGLGRDPAAGLGPGP